MGPVLILGLDLPPSGRNAQGLARGAAGGAAFFLSYARARAIFLNLLGCGFPEESMLLTIVSDRRKDPRVTIGWAPP
jgi:hypothetical protein